MPLKGKKSIHVDQTQVQNEPYLLEGRESSQFLPDWHCISVASRVCVCLGSQRKTWWEATKIQSVDASGSALRTTRQGPGTGVSSGPSQSCLGAQGQGASGPPPAGRFLLSFQQRPWAPWVQWCHRGGRPRKQGKEAIEGRTGRWPQGCLQRRDKYRCVSSGCPKKGRLLEMRWHHHVIAF